MCGICGVFETDRSLFVQRDPLSEMNQQITHRGPDDEGTYFDGSVGLGMRRLSIIDIRTGHQPITNEDKTVCIVYNGDYNHQDLRKDLEARGHRYRSKSDTETMSKKLRASHMPAR
jgi:asparagine synthase (glutamine-hydrolysing)